MIRVLQLGMTDNLGGIETFLMNYYRNIDREKIQFDFINIYPNKLCFQDEIEQLGGRVYKVSSYYKHPIKYIKEVVDIINKNNYKIVHCNMNSAAMLYPLIAGKKSNAKVVIAHAHNNSSDKGIIKTLLHNINRHFIHRYANEFFACSNEAGKWFFNKKVMKSNKYNVIYNAIELEKYRYNENERKIERNKFNIDESTLVIGNVGRFTKQKNQIFLISVFYEICKKNNNSKLILIGKGPLEKRLKKKVKKLELEKNVIFLKDRNDLYKIYNIMDIFVLPSIYEGLGIVNIEAQANGLVCVVSDCVPKICKISDELFFYKLNNGKEKWSNFILEKDKKRIKIDLSKCKFNIYVESKKLMEIYFDLLLRKEKFK